MEKLIIIGSGCAGLTAAIYAARANLEPLLFTGAELGGQIATTTDVENFPAFPQGITGPELFENMRQQAERFGTRIEIDEVVGVQLPAGGPFSLRTAGGAEHQARALIVATGASPRKLGVPGEAEYTGRGVSYCATCDGFFFRGKELVVVGGGDSALQEGLFLTKFARRVRIVHRRDELRAGPALQARADANEKLDYIWNTVVTAIEGGNGQVDHVRLRDVQTGAEQREPVDGVFVYIGHLPNTWLFKDQLAMDAENYLIVDRRQRTSVPGVFAAGEVHDSWFKQAVSSAGFGCMAAMEAEHFLAEHGH
jgi:thioredoxin reductase (NADPH)